MRLTRRQLSALGSALLVPAALRAPPAAADLGSGHGLVRPTRPVTGPSVAARATLAGAVSWEPGPVLNQYRSSACVGFAFTAELLADPMPDRTAPPPLARRFAHHLYERARWLAGYDGLPPGTSLESGAIACRDYGLIDDWAWARSMAELDAALAAGPVVVATDWFESMNVTSRSENLRLSPATRSPSPLYHALVVLARDPARLFPEGRRPAYYLRNSWGRRWGRRLEWRRTPSGNGRGHVERTGSGWIRATDLEWLLADFGWQYGAACVPLGRRPVDLAGVLAAPPDPHVGPSGNLRELY